MKWQYEKIYVESGKTEEEIKEARRFFDREKKRLKYENMMIKKYNVSFLRISDLKDKEDRMEIDIRDDTANVEEEALTSIYLEKLEESLMILSEKERWLIFRHYYEDTSLRKIAQEEGVATSTVQYWFTKIYDKLRKEMGVKIDEQ